MEELIKLGQANIMSTYNRYPIVLVRGEGCRVWDAAGKEYLDFVAGLAVCNLGHCHPRVVAAIREQAGKLLHVSNLYWIEPQIKLAELLCDNSFADKVFFCNSGAEANEAAIKLARKYAKETRGAACHEIITMRGSFHGRTMATLTATAQEKFHKGFEPLLPGFKYVPYGDIEAVRQAVGPETAAIMVEPIQGEGGVNLPPKGYLQGLRKICDEHRTLLILDEVQTGMGRTGKLFAYEHYGIEPDIMTLAKGLGGGAAIGAMLAKDSIAKALSPGTHAATFGGNPLACAAGLASLTAVLEDDILKNTQEMGGYLENRLKNLTRKYDFISEVRGKGLMVGMELKIEGRPIVAKCLEQGLLINCTADKVLRFLPPLIAGKPETDEMIERLDTVLRD